MIWYKIDPNLHLAGREPQLLEDWVSATLSQQPNPAGANLAAPARRSAVASDF